MLFFRKKFCLCFVCTANRTRSAYLAGYLTHFLKQYRPSGLKKLHVVSAGTRAVEGGRANDVVALVAQQNGFSLRNHKALALDRHAVRQADLILVMEQEHKNYILEHWPDAANKTFRLMEYGWTHHADGPAESLDVPDPTGKTVEDFRAFLDTAHAEADRLVHELVHREII